MYRVTEPDSSEQFEKIYELRYTVLREPWDQHRGTERDDAEQSSVHAMIVNERDECIATGRLQFNSKEEGQIRYMAVDDRYRGQHLGKQILDYLEAKAKAHGCRKMILQAREVAVEFYQAMGYSVEEKSFLLFDAIQHYRMSKNL